MPYVKLPFLCYKCCYALGVTWCLYVTHRFTLMPGPLECSGFKTVPFLCIRSFHMHPAAIQGLTFTLKSGFGPDPTSSLNLAEFLSC